MDFLSCLGGISLEEKNSSLIIWGGRRGRGESDPSDSLRWVRKSTDIGFVCRAGLGGFLLSHYHGSGAGVGGLGTGRWHTLLVCEALSMIITSYIFNLIKIWRNLFYIPIEFANTVTKSHAKTDSWGGEFVDQTDHGCQVLLPVGKGFQDTLGPHAHVQRSLLCTPHTHGGFWAEFSASSLVFALPPHQCRRFNSISCWARPICLLPLLLPQGTAIFSISWWVRPEYSSPHL